MTPQAARALLVCSSLLNPRRPGLGGHVLATELRKEFVGIIALGETEDDVIPTVATKPMAALTER